MTCTWYVRVLLKPPSLPQLAAGWRREAEASTAVTLCSRRSDLLPSLVRWLTLSENVNVRIFSSPVRIGNMLTVMCLWTRMHPRLRWWQVLVNMVVNFYSSSTDYIAICLLFFPSWNYIFLTRKGWKQCGHTLHHHRGVTIFLRMRTTISLLSSEYIDR